jgi:transposase
MSRYRLHPDASQEEALLRHCADARYVWNLAVEQHSWWTPGRTRRTAPGFAAQCKQLTEARAQNPWLGSGSVNVQQQALRDFAQAMSNFFAGTHGKPDFRKKHIHEGLRITDFTFTNHVRRLNRRWGQVKVPKVGWVRFRWTRTVPECKSYRITRERAGRWHVAFAVIPPPTEAPGNGKTVGIDRGVKITAALSDGQTLHCPQLSVKERARLRKAERREARAPKKSEQLAVERQKIATLKAREADRRKDWCEKTSTRIARRYDLIRLEDLRIKNMTRSAKGTVEQPGTNVRQKAGLNRAILAQGWGLLAQRIAHKAQGRTEKVTAVNTSLRCSDCGWIDKNSRQSQATFCCTTCGFTLNADHNAAINVAAGQVCAAEPRSRSRAGGTTRRKVPSVREPQSLAVGIPRL